VTFNYDFVINDKVANSGLEHWQVRKIEGFGGKQVTRAWIRLVLAGTWADHYAEAAMYLRLNGVLPPTAKK